MEFRMEFELCCAVSISCVTVMNINLGNGALATLSKVKLFTQNPPPLFSFPFKDGEGDFIWFSVP